MNESVLTGAEQQTVVCATARLARELRAHFNESMRESGRAVWEKPAVHSLRGWLDQLWLSTWPTLNVATPGQELSLWHEVVESSGAADQVISTMGVARQARHAYQLAREHSISERSVWEFASPEHRSFSEWRVAFEARCADAHVLPRAALLDHVAEAVESGRLKIAGKVRFEGFLTLTPQLKRLITALETYVLVEVAERGGIANPSSPAFWRPLNPRDEAQAVAGAVRGLLEEAAQSGQDAPRISVAMLDPEEGRVLLEQALRESLRPDRADGVVDEAEPWRFVRGQPLYLHPLAAAALDALRLDRHGNELSLVSRVLLSPFLWGGNDEKTLRARADLSLRERGARQISLAAAGRAIARRQDTVSDSFTRLEALQLEIENRHGKASPTGWKERFETRLSILGFPGGKSESSVRFQVYNAIRESLAELATLDSISPALTEAQARHWLREIMVARLFEPRVEHDQPVQIIPVQDVAGLKFDHVFVVGLSSSVLPQPRITSAFLDPAELEKRVPGASATGRLEEAKLLLDMLGNSSPRITWSCPLYDDQGALLLPSALVGPWPMERVTCERAPSLLESVVASGVCTTVSKSEVVPPVLNPEAEGVRGGVSILADYSTAPFLAFCRARLGIEDFPDEAGGLDARVQGNLLHAALQRIWGELKDSSTLKNYLSDESRITPLIEGAVLDAAEIDGMLPAEAFGKELTKMERTRLAALLRAWLEHEAQRPHPFRVVCIEKKTHATIEGLPLKLRLDRVDCITIDGAEKFLAIDYKSGFSIPSGGWAPDSLSEPQLPIYATFADLSELGIPCIDGIALAQVAEGRCGFRVWSNFTGRLVADSRGAFGKAVFDWPRLCEDWKKFLSAAARGFLAGDAKLLPGALNGSPFTRYLAPFDRNDVRRGG